MKKNKIFAIITSMLLILTACSGKLPENIAAKVNNKEITMDYFNKTLVKMSEDNGFEQLFGPAIWDKEIEAGKTFRQKFEEQVIDIIVTQELIYQEAEKNGLLASEEEVNQEYKAYTEILTQDPQYKEAMEKNNIDEDFVRESLKKTITYSKYVQSILDSIEITEEEIKNYYEKNLDNFKTDEVSAKHILISTKADDGSDLTDAQKEEKLKLAQSILDKISKGESFEDLAKEYSNDPGSAQNGGSLGYFPRGVMVSEFEEAAFALKVGEVSNIIETVFGYHIIKVEDKKSSTTSFEDAKESIISELEHAKYSEKIKEIMDKSKTVLNEKFEANK